MFGEILLALSAMSIHSKRLFRLVPGSVVRLSLVLLIVLLTASGIGQTSKKQNSTNAPTESCMYGSRFFRLHSYQAHGISCQQCVAGGKWADVGGQYCAASKPQRQVGQTTRPKGHLCSKESLSYSVGAVYYDGADDCSRCTDRASPNDWDALDKQYFCENVNPAGDASELRPWPTREDQNILPGDIP